MFASLTLISFFGFFIWIQHAFLNRLMSPDAQPKANLHQEESSETSDSQSSQSIDHCLYL